MIRGILGFSEIRTLFLAGVSTIALLAPAAMAQQAGADDDEGIEEIIVTSTKRGAQGMQSVPISIQAITDKTLTARGIRDFADYAISVPGLRYEDLGPGDKRIFIRGINSIGAATTGIYYDEAVITASNKEDGGGRNLDLKMFDIERVEVLKGPQGTLYGASSMSGTIRIITNKPDSTEFYAYVDASLGGTRRGGTNWEINGMVNIPLIEGVLAARLVAYNVDNSGFIDNPRLGTNNINDEETIGGRLHLRWTPSDNLTVLASATIQETDAGGTSRVTPEGTFGHVPTAGFPPVFGGDFKSVSFTKDTWEDNANIYSLTAEYDAGWGSFLATTNWFERDINFNFDSTPILFFFGVPIPGITEQPQYRRIWSNEVRFASNFDGPFQMVAGVLVQREKTDFNVHVIVSDPITGKAVAPWDPSPGNDALTSGGNAFFGRTAKSKIDQEAFFGELSYDVTEDVNATFGVRYFQSDQVSSEQETHQFADFPNAPRPPIADNFATADKVTKKFNISWQATNDTLLFATAAQGFRTGGVNAAAIPFVAEGIPRSFGPDNLWNYEVGIKTSLLDNRLVVNASLYQIDWNKMQTVSKDRSGAFQFLANARDARVKGLEWDVYYQPAENWNFQFGGTIARAELIQDQPATITQEFAFTVDNPGRAGDPIPNTPSLTLNGSGEYSWPINADLMGRARVDWAYVGQSRTEFLPKGPANTAGFNRFTETVGGYNTVNVRFSVEGPQYTASVFIQNATDVRAVVDTIASDQDPLSELINRPRTIGVNLRYNF